MKKLLRIDTSTRGEESHSRSFADKVEAKWKQKHPDGDMIIRDLVKESIPHLTNNTILGYYTPKDDHTPELQEATWLSDSLIKELKGCNTILLSAPMYNFSIPSSLKAYIDQITRINETFSMDENGFTGLLSGKKVYIVLSYGAVYSGTQMEAMDFVEPYLKSLFGFLGISDIEIFKLEGSSVDMDFFNTSLQKASEKLELILEK